jgi:hypothetical protein
MPRVASPPPARRRAPRAGALAAALAALAAGAALPAAPAGAQPARGRPAPRAQARAPRAGADTGAAGTAARLLADVTYLAGDALEGRLTGSPGADSAAAFIARRFAGLRLRPVVVTEDDAARCAPMRVSAGPARVAAGARAYGPAHALHGPAAGDEAAAADAGRFPRCASFFQRFPARPAAHGGAAAAALPAQNVVALVEGTDPALRGQVVVVGAHYDHLGRESTFAADPKAGRAIRNGADDNASGTAAVMELARRLAARPARRSVLFVAFSAEELGVLGSSHFVAHSPVPVDSMAAMLNFDMVGRLRDDRLIVYGTGTAAEWPAVVDSANAAGPRLAVRPVADGVGPSDHSVFYFKRVPVLHFFTDVHPDYHAATDDVDKFNAPGASRVVALAEGVLRRAADRPERLTFRETPGTARMSAGPGPDGRPRPYFGSVPDMAGDPSVEGLRLQGVTPGSPADRAGLREGDVVVELGGAAVTDLETYTAALYAHAPGDTVTVVVRRGAERVTTRATLGRRGE